MQLDLDDVGGAKELAQYRISVAKEDIDFHHVQVTAAPALF